MRPGINVTGMYVWSPGDPLTMMVVVDSERNIISTYFDPTDEDVRRASQDFTIPYKKLQWAFDTAYNSRVHTLFIDAKVFRNADIMVGD